MKELWAKIREALISALPITLIVYLIALLPGFSFNRGEMIGFTIGAVLLVLGIGFFNLGADIAMTPMGTHVGAGLSRQKSIGLLLVVEKEIRDKVLHALYKEMGMQQKAQGIVFSLPVSDAAGLASAPEKEEEHPAV